ncbi:MAG: hypothetical protein ABL900_12955 [Burkholderiaceae bacterium]
MAREAGTGRGSGSAKRDSRGARSTPAQAQALSLAAASLRKLSHGEHSRFAVVRRANGGRQLALIDAVGRRVQTPHSLEQLVDEFASGQAEIGEHDATNKAAPGQSGTLRDESFVRLCWLVGARLGRDVGLAPWLDTSTSYRLLSWPDFGEIGEDPQAARLFAVIARHELSIAEMVRSLQLPQRSVHQVINGLSMCGLLTSGSVPRGHPAGAPRGASDAPSQRSSWWARFWRGLRS